MPKNNFCVFTKQIRSILVAYKNTHHKKICKNTSLQFLSILSRITVIHLSFVKPFRLLMLFNKKSVTCFRYFKAFFSNF